jgi:hypothetical protein
MATQSRNLEGKGAQRARRRKGTMSGREARHGCYSRDEPLFKGRLPRSRLEMSREVSPDAHRGIHPMTRGPGPTSHTRSVLPPRGRAPPSSWPRPTVMKANRRTRSVLPPHGSAPPRLRRNQRSNLSHGGPDPHVMYLARRFLCAGKANRRVKSASPPVVVRLFASAKTNNPVPGTRARAHESSSLGAGSWVQRSRTAARASTAPPWGHRRRLRR